MKLEHALAQGLAEQLAPLLPEPLMLQAKGSVVRASCPNGLWTETRLAPIVNQPGAVSEHLISAAHSVLSSMQDFVVLNTRSPWPVPEGGTGSTEGSYLHPPGVSIKENTLHLWYGGQSDPVVELAPLPLPHQDRRD